MLTVTRSRWMPYTPDQMFEALTDTRTLESVFKRIKAARVLDRTDDEGSVEIELDLPARKVIRTTGRAAGKPGERISFTIDKPFPLAFKWEFEPQGSGTVVIAHMETDLSSMVAPFSYRLVSGIIGSEVDSDLQRLEKWMHQYEAIAETA